MYEGRKLSCSFSFKIAARIARELGSIVIYQPETQWFKIYSYLGVIIQQKGG
jgi:hypothetical protein